jgi:hypothetical protein
MRKWLILILLAMVFLVVMCVSGIVRGEAQEFPYKDWKIVSVERTSDGIWGIFLQNPEDKTEIVVIILKSIDILLLKQDKPSAEIRL